MNRSGISDVDVPALAGDMARVISKRDGVIKLQRAALTTALKELGRRHNGSPECTEAIKQIREALER